MAKAKKWKPKHRTAKPALSAREVRFCVGFVEHGNRTRAYKEAGFDFEGKDENAITQAARYLLRKSQVRAYIRDLQDAAAVEAGITVGKLVRGFWNAADANLTDALAPDGTVLPHDQWPVGLQKAVQSIKTRELWESQPDPDDAGKKKRVQVGVEHEIKIENKTENRKVLATWLGMVGPDAVTAATPPQPLVVTGADVEKL